MQKTRTRFRSTRAGKKLEPLKIAESSFNEKFQNNINDIVADLNDEEKKTDQDVSDTATVKKRKQSEDLNRTNDAGSQQQIASSASNISNQLRTPYEFIGVTSPSLRTIILPRFSFKSVTFVMSVVMLVMFITLFVVHQTRPQSPTSWGCLLFTVQNKFYPRLRLGYEFWRIPVSGLFHSNFIGLKLYGYFIEWYIGSLKFAGLAVLAIINAHLLSCLTDKYTVSTVASGILYAMLAVKILFFIKYRNYEPLNTKRIALYGLLGLIFGMNILVLFVGGNVDVGGHVGGLVTGFIYGAIFYQFQQQTTKTKIFRYCMVALLAAFSVAIIGACFGIQSQTISDINMLIDDMC